MNGYLSEYLQGMQGWRSRYSFRNKKIAGPPWGLGYCLGRITGVVGALFRSS
jgi:hypothetical protein